MRRCGILLLILTLMSVSASADLYARNDVNHLMDEASACELSASRKRRIQ